MSLRYTFIGFFLIGVFVSSCAPSGPSDLEVLNSFEAALNDEGLEGTMVLFVEDAVVLAYGVLEETEFFGSTVLTTYDLLYEFRNVSVEGDTATFDWVMGEELLTAEATYARVEFQDGKITFLGFGYGEPQTIQNGEE